MRLPTGFFVLCVLLSVVAEGRAAASRRPAPTAEGKVGLVMRDYTPSQPRNWRGAETHSLRVLIWYPAAASANEQQQWIGPPEKPLIEAGSAMPHAAFAYSLAKFPLVLLSHGTGGSAEQMGWLGTALARNGFVAAAVEHPGNNSENGPLTAEGFTLWWERATDQTEVLDGLLHDPELSQYIDRERVGVAGFSLGGYTALELGGARTDIAALFDRCHTGKDEAVCRPPEMRDLGSPEQILESVRKTSGESLARSGDSFRDGRVRAVFAIAPALGFTLTPESLKSVRMPVEIVVGEADTLAPAAENATYVRSNIRGARETVLPGVGHYTFLGVCTDEGKQRLPRYCADGAGVDRRTVHGQVSGMAVQFFERWLQ